MSRYQDTHQFDLEDPTVSMAYLGDPVDEFVAFAEADGWVVRRYGDGHPKGDGVETLEVKPYDTLRVRSRGGKVTAIGGSAWITQPIDEA